MSIDNPTCLLDLALGAEERANHRCCDLEDLRDALVKQIHHLVKCIEKGGPANMKRVNAVLKKVKDTK